MAISRAQLAKELEPGLNSLFGMSYDSYSREYEQIFAIEDSQRAFEEEVLVTGFGGAPVKTEGQGVQFDNASESYTARYTHDTIALAFSLTEEAVEESCSAQPAANGTAIPTVFRRRWRQTTISSIGSRVRR